MLFDYGATMGIDINKDLFALVQSYILNQRFPMGYYSEGVAVLDNYVFNHGHKGFNVAGTWAVVRGNRNDRIYLTGGEKIHGVDKPWRLTIDGFVESSGGGGGMISDNYSRAFDLAGKNLWIDGNTYNNLGSRPGNDGEGILCQFHNGTHWYSWAATRNRHDQGDGQRSYIGSWDSETAGMLIAWNKTAGWVGVQGGTTADIAVVGNDAGEGVRVPQRSTAVTQPAGQPAAPTLVKVEVYADDRANDAAKISWTDGSDNEIGFRIDRRIDGGSWTAVAYRPPHVDGSPMNPQAWVDFMAPAQRRLEYRVAAIAVDDGNTGASAPAGLVVLNLTPQAPATRRTRTTRPATMKAWEDADAPVRSFK